MEEIKTGGSVEEDKSATGVPIVKPLVTDERRLKMNFSRKTVVIFLGVLVLGIVSGYRVYLKDTAGLVRLSGRDVEVVKTATEEGVKDASTFRDTATGKLQENDGKLTDEGTQVLIRGDASQNVYLTSSVVDMSKYVGKKVQVWGETFKGRKAGWLMDVGRIKIVE